MRIAIDGRYVYDHFPGIGRYAYSLCRALALLGGHEIVFLCDPAATNSRFPLADLARLPGVNLRQVRAGAFAPRAQVMVPWALRRERVDVIHSPYYVRPYFTFTPTVVTLHDAIPILFPTQNGGKRTRLVFEMTTKLTMATATRVIAGSQAAQRDFGKLFGVPEAKMRVVYHGVDERYRPQPGELQARAKKEYNLPDRFVLYVGINKPHKNLRRLVEAFGCLDDKALVLAIAGPEDPRYPEIRALVEHLALGERVRFLGQVKEEALPALYSAATVFAFPSLYEGFGLPVLEAMACGTPVVSSNASSMPEVAGDAALLVPPDDVCAWVDTLRRVLSDETLRSELAARGPARAARFSWEHTARATLDVYREAVAR